MAQKTEYTCDRCGKPITEDRHAIVMETGQLKKLFTEGRVDLCSACTQKFSDWLKEGRKENALPSDSPEEEFPLGPVGKVARRLPQ